VRPAPALMVALLTLAGCTEQSPADGAANGTGGDTPSASPPVITKRTTRADVALSNLDAQIGAAELALGADRAVASTGAMLVDLYAARARFAGSFGDFAKMESVAERLVSEYGTAEAYATRSAFFSGVHEFDAAASDLGRAQELGLDGADTLLFNVELATDGDVERAVAHHREHARAFPSFHTLSTLATAEAALGDFWSADAHYVEAALSYRDVSPLPLAWLAFARGVMWAEMANRPDYAEPLYREAVERIPSYVVANVHLAEIEAQEGDASGALERLLRIAESTEDPEPIGFIAELLAESDPEASARYTASARERYEGLLATYPLAFADHAAEFFSGPAGADPERGVELALDNLENRPTPRAYIVALGAARARGLGDLVCELRSAAEPLRSRSVNLALLLDELGCPETTRTRRNERRRRRRRTRRPGSRPTRCS
jgi:tetratricopeptide (TPR) repeat protein